MTPDIAAAAPLDAAALRQIDARYAPFPEFENWSGGGVALTSWNSERDELTRQRATAGVDAINDSVQKAMRAAASDTGALEGLYAHDRGFTISVATEVAAWEAELAKKSADVRALLEAQLLAYELALDAATRRTEIGEAWIRRLHEVLTSAQREYEVFVPLGGQLLRQRQQLPHGEYKRFPNHVRLSDGTFHAYAPVVSTPDEMRRLVSELSGEAFARAHPVLQAAYAHYALVAIHPFADGNGRVARALSSVFLLRSASIPLVIFYEQRNEYFDVLAAADGGRPEPFIRLIRDASLDTMRVISSQLRPGPEKYEADLQRLLTSPGGLAYEDVANLARTLIPMIHDELERQTATIPLPRGVRRLVQYWGSGANFSIKGHQQVSTTDATSVFVGLDSSTPSASAGGQLHIFVGPSDEDEPILVVWEGDGTRREHFRVRVRDVHPAVTLAFRARLTAWVRALLGEVAASLVGQLTQIHGRSQEPPSS